MNNKFSLVLKSLRKDKNYTQKDLSSLLGIGQNSIRVPDMFKLMEIADLFNVSLDYLMGRENYKLDTDKIDIINSNNNYSYEDYFSNLLEGNKEECVNISLNILTKGNNLIRFYEEIIYRSLVDIGLLWEKGAIDIWKEHLVSELSISIMTTLYSKFIYNIKNINKTVIGLTPGAETHNIGLRMVCDVFNTEGWNSIYLGCNIPTISVLDAIKENKPEAILLSVTLPQHIESAKNLIQAIRKFYNKNSLSIIVGGLAFENLKDVNKYVKSDYYFKNLKDVKSYLSFS